MNFADRCAIASACLPKADYRTKLEALHAEMLAALDVPEAGFGNMTEPVGWQWLNTAHFRRSIPATSNAAEWRPIFAEMRDQP